ncbi:MAG: hypothetical protein BJ554DRAFT_2395 [Olpidium bornovanus]|uniref:Uncharacterized protein n=1 Tax=Olpidium bornovanus TaxID=278681 RepID=A0A8H8DGZ3_9FUNG|nr:MAG: hypothetical protein BJ554DRAFT_2395 [Olpidium bornovanus]
MAGSITHSAAGIFFIPAYQQPSCVLLAAFRAPRVAVLFPSENLGPALSVPSPSIMPFSVTGAGRSPEGKCLSAVIYITGVSFRTKATHSQTFPGGAAGRAVGGKRPRTTRPAHAAAREEAPTTDDRPCERCGRGRRPGWAAKCGPADPTGGEKKKKKDSRLTGRAVGFAFPILGLQVGVLGFAEASRQTHEGGKRHKEAVTKFLSDVRQRSAQEKKEQEDVKKRLEKIEQVCPQLPAEGLAALAAYQKDLANEAGGPVSPPPPAAAAPPPPPQGASQPRASQPTLPTPAKRRTTATAANDTPLVPRLPVGDEYELSTVPGPWKRVRPDANRRKEEATEGTSSQIIFDDDDGEGVDPDDLRDFKVKEKAYPGGVAGAGYCSAQDTQPHTGETSFKKRKTGIKNIRKK